MCRVHHEKCVAGWIPSWNQDCWEKYQQSQICRWYHPNGRHWIGSKELLDEGERREWKSWLKTQHSKHKDHGIWSHHFMANIWGNNGRFYFLGLQNQMLLIRCYCSHEIKRHWRKAMANLDRVLKSRDITLLINVCTVKTMVSPVVMYGCKNWTIKKAECWRIDALELWSWRRLLRVPWTVRRSNQSILKEINPEYSLEVLMLKLQYFGHLIQRADSLEKTLMLGKIEGRRIRG